MQRSRWRVVWLIVLAAALLPAALWASGLWNSARTPVKQAEPSREAVLHAPFRASGVATRLADGDSFTFQTEFQTEFQSEKRGAFEVRMHAIDAPERVQAHGNASHDALRELIDGRRIDVECYKTDPRGREICRVYRGQLDVQLAMIERGAAWHFTQFVHEQTPQERKALAAAQRDAQTARRGLWAQDNPQAPWDCRTRLRALQLCR